MTPWVATLVKLRSDDGFWNIQAPVKVGKEYRIDLDSRRTEKFVHQPTGDEFDCEVVTVLEPLPGEQERFFPVELLEI